MSPRPELGDSSDGGRGASSSLSSSSSSESTQTEQSCDGRSSRHYHLLLPRNVEPEEEDVMMESEDQEHDSEDSVMDRISRTMEGLLFSKVILDFN